MSQIAEGYFKALLALSGDSTLAGARRILMTGITDKQLEETIRHGILKGASRQVLESMIVTLLEEHLGGTAVGGTEGKMKRESEDRDGEQVEKAIAIESSPEPQANIAKAPTTKSARVHRRRFALRKTPLSRKRTPTTFSDKSIKRQRTEQASVSGEAHTDDEQVLGFVNAPRGRRNRKVNYREETSESEDDSGESEEDVDTDEASYDGDTSDTEQALDVGEAIGGEIPEDDDEDLDNTPSESITEQHIQTNADLNNSCLGTGGRA
ncbi:hypothetical protein NX059_006563 [Plenodomus lindquistii]|nr:hypothetical protein NX059_006563 [Plenodomus lindquistii]